MTIASEIARLQGVKADILGAIAEKKVDVPSGAMLADAPELIRSIKSGINVKIGQGVYPAVKIGNQLWLARNLDEELGTLGVDEWYYNGRSVGTYINASNSCSKNLSDDYIQTFVYDWNDGHITSFTAQINVAKLAGKYFRISCTATLRKSQSGKVNVSARFVYLNSPTSLTSYTTIIGTIEAGQTSLNIDVSINDIPEGVLKGLQRLDFITTRSGTGIDGTTRIDFTNIKMFASPEQYTSTPTNAITVQQALANEATAKANNYGRLYTWKNVNENLSKLGLTKWRWATKEDFEKLSLFCGGDSVAGSKLKSKKGWSTQGTDEFGFNGFPCGQFNGEFIYIKDALYLWSATETGSNKSIRRRLNNTNSFTESENENNKDGYSIRLVMDLNEDGTIPDSNIVIEDVPATTAEPLALASEPIVTEEVE